MTMQLWLFNYYLIIIMLLPANNLCRLSAPAALPLRNEISKCVERSISLRGHGVRYFVQFGADIHIVIPLDLQTGGLLANLFGVSCFAGPTANVLNGKWR